MFPSAKTCGAMLQVIGFICRKYSSNRVTAAFHRKTSADHLLMVRHGSELADVHQTTRHLNLQGSAK